MANEEIDKKVAEFKEAILEEIESLISECGTCKNRTTCERVLSVVINESLGEDIDSPRFEGRFLEFKEFIALKLRKTQDNKALYNKCLIILCDLLSEKVCCGYP